MVVSTIRVLGSAEAPFTLLKVFATFSSAGNQLNFAFLNVDHSLLRLTHKAATRKRERWMRALHHSNGQAF
ncbi:hypothetical protein [Brevundimonas denitrificans]|uniref:hypothetical protein n=1 Tax=Brevundimonas denitrificans TaxID=1443434 RepID=UPI00352D2072